MPEKPNKETDPFRDSLKHAYLRQRPPGHYLPDLEQTEDQIVRKFRVDMVNQDPTRLAQKYRKLLKGIEDAGIPIETSVVVGKDQHGDGPFVFILCPEVTGQALSVKLDEYRKYGEIDEDFEKELINLSQALVTHLDQTLVRIKNHEKGSFWADLAKANQYRFGTWSDNTEPKLLLTDVDVDPGANRYLSYGNLQQTCKEVYKLLSSFAVSNEIERKLEPILNHLERIGDKADNPFGNKQNDC